MAHSIIPPSSAHIWGAPNGCPGWVLMSQLYPELEDSEESKEGTAAHWVAEEMIDSLSRAKIGHPEKEDIVGTLAPNHVVITEEMYEAAELYASDVAEVMHQTRVLGGENLGIEARVKAPHIHELSEGTVDCYLYSRKTNELFIWDFKFGHGIVEAYDNWQAINYTSGILDTLGIDGELDQRTTVRIRIAQPRAFHRDGAIREWAVKASDLRGKFNILHNNAAKALSPDAKCNSGSHCKYCSARHACPTALAAGMQLYEVAGAAMPVELSDDALATQYAIVQRALKQLEYLESGYQEQLKSRLRSGASVQGYRVEEGKGRERWAKPVEEVIAMGDMLGHDLRNLQAITPNQAKKLGVDESVIIAYSETPKTGLKLVPDDGNKAKLIFGDNQT